ncbi:MAG: hypothetical protein ABII06_11960 [Pseudomonadota bacterium]
MKILLKIVLFCAIAVFLILAAAGGGILYLYYHPSEVKPFIETSLSKATGTACSIQELAYSIRPLMIRARGIVLKPKKGADGFHLNLSEVKADMALEGEFGRRRLNFKILDLKGLSVAVSQDLDLPKGPAGSRGPSALGTALRRAASFFLFKEFVFEAAELSDGDVEVRSGDRRVKALGLHGRLNPEHFIEISFRLEGESPSDQMNFNAPYVHMVTDQALSLSEPEIRGQLTLRDCVFESAQGRLKGLNLKTVLRYHFSRRETALSALDLRIQSLETGRGAEAFSLKTGISLRAQGQFNLKDQRMKIPDFALSMGDILEMKGGVQGVLAPQPEFELHVKNASLTPRKVLSLLPKSMRGGLSPETLSGPVTLRGNVSLQRKKEKWDILCDLKTRLEGNAFAFHAGDQGLKGALRGEIQTSGRFPELRLQAAIKGEDMTLSNAGNLDLKPFTAGLSLSGTYPIFQTKDLRIRIPSAGMTIAKKTVRVDDISLHAPEGKLNIDKKSVTLPLVKLDSSLLKNITLALRAEGDTLQAEITGEKSRLIESAKAFGFIPSGWQFSGEDSLKITLVQKGRDPWILSTGIDLKGLAVQSPDGTILGEKLSLRAELNGNLDMAGSTLSADTLFEISGGELLYERFYFDFKKNRLSSSGQGRFDTAKKRLTISDFNVGMKDMFILHARGHTGHTGPSPDVRLSCSLDEAPLKPLFEQFLLGPYKTEKPFLERLTPSGRVSLNLELRGKGKDWNIKGLLGWHEGGLFAADGRFDFKGIDLELPLWFQSNEGEPEKSPLKGKVIIGDMRVPPFLQQPLDIPLEAGPNRFSIPSPTRFQIPGGSIRLAPLFCMDAFTSKNSIETGLELAIDDPDALLRGLLPIPVKGAVRGTLSPLRLQGGSLHTAGPIGAKLFGGAVLFSDIGARGLFSSAPVYRLGAQWKDLNLAELTTNTAFGKVDGILHGRIRGLEIAYGQPQKFDLLLETSERKGIPQKISVRAVDNIAQIGGGQSPFVGMAGVLTSFFKEFSYKKIGIHASLENDVFKINGTIKDGQKEYLIKRSGFSGVDVVNQNPDNRIRFKDMVKRMKRVTATRDGPVVK